MTGRPRLVIALVVATMLVAFMGYQLIAGADQLVVSVGQLRADRAGAAHKTVQLTGMVVSASNLHGTGAHRFVLRDEGSPQSVEVVYRDDVPDAFRVGRRVIVTGRMQGADFVGQPGSLLTKCPSKYSAGGGGQ
jgi:cytochrome c-type biogenesis protein CcmE